MTTTVDRHESEMESRIGAEIDLPVNRQYDDDADAKLDEALVTAIERADAADNDFLVSLLTRELGSHFYSTR